MKSAQVLKLYAWEPSFQKTVEEIRDKEVKVLKQAAFLNGGTSFIWTCAPFLVCETIYHYIITVMNDDMSTCLLVKPILRIKECITCL